MTMNQARESATDLAEAPAAPSEWAQVLRRVTKHHLGLVSFFTLALLIIGAVLGPVISPYGYADISLTEISEGPSLKHWFGTDELGRDAFTRIMHGARVSLTVGFLVAISTVTIGGLVGCFVGYVGGRLDNFVMRIVDVMHTVPKIVILLVLSKIFGGGLWSIIIILVFLEWTGSARLTRSVVLSLREQPFIEAAVAIGASRKRIVFRHIMLNSLAPLIVYATLDAGGAIRAETTLSFLGMGIQAPAVSWGNLLAYSRVYIFTNPWMVMIPGMFIFLALMSFNLVGDALRDALDPRLKGR